MLKQTIGNHTELLKLDLQFFAGEEDAILPDDYAAESDPFEEQETFLDDEQLESEVDTNETDEEDVNQQEEQQEAERQAFLKIKYNSEEKGLSEDEARELAQMGMNYPKLQEKLQALESDPRLSFIEELASEQGMDINEYLEAVRSAREDAKLQELIENNIPEEYAREMLESRKDREERQKEKAARAEEEANQKDGMDFLEYFRQENNRDYDSNKDQIPQEVWEANKQGVPLKFAYMQHHNQQLKTQLKTLKQNETNAKRAPVGSLTTFGSDEPTSEDDFLKGFNSI